MTAASIQVVVLSLWLGAALCFAAVVAPAAFAVLPTRSLAGALVGRVLPTIFYAGILAGVVVAGSLVGTRRLASWLAATVVIVACGVAQFVVGARIERLRTAIGGALDGLPADDLRRAAFGRLHGVSVALLGAAMVAALLGIIVAARDAAARN